jgi:hypothetical protein
MCSALNRKNANCAFVRRNEAAVHGCMFLRTNPVDDRHAVGLTAYTVEYWTGSAWIQIPDASVTGNNKIWRKFEFSPISTSKIRVVTSASVDGYSRLTEVEATDQPTLVVQAVVSTGWCPINSARRELLSIKPAT